MLRQQAWPWRSSFCWALLAVWLHEASCRGQNSPHLLPAELWAQQALHAAAGSALGDSRRECSYAACMVRSVSKAQ